MAAFVHTAGTVFLTHLSRMLRSRRMVVMLLAAAVPALPVIAVTLRQGPDYRPDLLVHVVWFVMLQVMLPVTALVGGSAVIAEEVADRTITWVFVRPVSRVAFFLGRWAAAQVQMAAVATVMVGFLLLTSAGSMAVAFDLLRPVLGAVLLGGLVYVTVFATIGAWFRHPMVAGVGYAFAMEALLANLPGTTAEASVLHQLRSILIAEGGPWLTIEQFPGMVWVPPADAVGSLVWILAIALLVGFRVVSRRQYGLVT